MPVQMKVLRRFSGRKAGDVFQANQRDVRVLELLGFAARYATRDMRAADAPGDVPAAPEAPSAPTRGRRYSRRDVTAEK